MKKLLFLLLIVCTSRVCDAQNWTSAQIAQANTGNEISYLTQVEKETILYINLCRLFPVEFVKNEVLNYYGTKKYGDYVKDSKYRKSLIEHLNSMEAVSVLSFDSACYKNAKCFAKEQGEAGTTGHQRIKCFDGNFAECCSYGMDTGKDIALQLLIDDKVQSLGHRKICLDKSYSKIGVSVNSHKKWDICAVVNFIW